MKNEEPKILYSSLDHPDRMAQTGLSAEEIRALLEKSYDDYDNMNFTFVGRKREG